MNRPTNDDLARLIPDAAREVEKQPLLLADAPMYLAGEAMAFLRVLVMSDKWGVIRALFLKVAYLCLFGAWEAGRRMAPAMLVNDGKGGLRPLDQPTETPAVKGVDVEALLRQADACGFYPPGTGPKGGTLVHRLAAALRAERERADKMTGVANERIREAREATSAAASHYVNVQHAHGYLRAVLAWGWPDGTTGPEPVRRARAFLRGEEQAPRHDDTREIELLRKELADKGAALERMVERYERVTHDLSRMTNDRNEWKAVAEAIGPAFQNDITKLRAELATEDEAATHLRAAANDALAAQNRAESEAAALRIEVTDLRRKVAEGETLVESLIAWAKKGRA
jgi:hypothetical protein